MTVELDGKCWEPVPGATATAAEFLAARRLISEIHQQCRWSPWVLQDRAGDYDAALEITGQWTSPGAGPPGKTLGEYEAEFERRMAEADARFLAEQAQAGKDRAERARHYDHDRAQARLALLEVQGILDDHVRERDEILSGARFPGASGKDRDRLLAGLERDIAAKTREAGDLAAVAGDPETVCDASGWLPAERRDLSLAVFKARRAAQVQDLRARVAEGEAAVKFLKGKTERAELRETLRKAKARLAWLEDMPPLEASAMCSECASPAPHTPGVTFDLNSGATTGGPCPAWPRWAERASAVREAMRRAGQGPPKAPPPAPPQPIAVLAPGTPIEDVITQLTAIQAGHPGAQIRPGKRHHWEIWPAPAEPAPAGD